LIRRWRIRESKYLQITTNFVVKRKQKRAPLKCISLANNERLCQTYMGMIILREYPPTSFEKFADASYDDTFRKTERFIPFSGTNRSDLLNFSLTSTTHIILKESDQLIT